ncbi:MAG: hypothetical protein AAGK02_16815 [Pseudomonadota bacterium]
MAHKTALRIASIVGITGLLALGAVAGPKLTAPTPDKSAAAFGPYALVCWQEGQKVFEERGVRSLASLELMETLDAQLTHADGSNRLLLTLGDALCIVEYQSE